MTIGADGYRTINNLDGTTQTFDKDGNFLNSGSTDQSSDTDTNLGGGGLDTGGGGLDIDTGGGGLDFGGGEGLENGDSSFGLDNQF